jgi:hypothetical protein
MTYRINTHEITAGTKLRVSSIRIGMRHKQFVGALNKKRAFTIREDVVLVDPRLGLSTRLFVMRVR